MVIAGYEERKRQAIVDFAEERITYDAMMAVFYESYSALQPPSPDAPSHLIESWDNGRHNAMDESWQMLCDYYRSARWRLNVLSTAIIGVVITIAVLVAFGAFALLA